MTSNKVLAQRDSNEKRALYEFFLLRCAHNIETERNQVIYEKICYESEIVYGTAHSFQADILRHEFH